MDDDVKAIRITNPKTIAIVKRVMSDTGSRTFSGEAERLIVAGAKALGLRQEQQPAAAQVGAA